MPTDVHGRYFCRLFIFQKHYFELVFHIVLEREREKAHCQGTAANIVRVQKEKQRIENDFVCDITKHYKSVKRREKRREEVKEQKIRDIK